MTESYVCHLCLFCIMRSGAPALVAMGQFLITWNQNNCVSLWFNILHIGGDALFKLGLYFFVEQSAFIIWDKKFLYLFLVSKFALVMMKSLKFINNNNNSFSRAGEDYRVSAKSGLATHLILLTSAF